ncbi:MAG: hypothetical protein KC544_07695 [Gemmatimonadetes bacterium]|nr:hypothetical protein [Gemmatimonadota bacterium]MCB9518960.1 hypothetical protein [Gemmatimonadales bacterium]MCA9762991.1 hypothetical protein [Gemmatimonadota bacterium]MCA9769566.1 hypothetical protein [Gemmatimonadota bacterium]HPF62414.1 hypothetical protein [Gemmatimonadales bacterium]
MSARTTTSRRGTALVSALVGVALAGALSLTATRPVSTAGQPQHDEWLRKLDGKHRMLFDAPVTNGGVPLVHMMNWYDTYNSAYGVKDADLDGVLTFYGMTTFHGLNDAMWAKYNLGAVVGETDADGNPATANPWRAAPRALGMTLPQASIETLQGRGATFLLCNNALTFFAGQVAQAHGLDPKAVYEEMKANILPGVTLVPGMVIAIDQAQEAGLSYHRQ